MWRMTPYKILALFRIHREFNPDRFKPEEKEADIDDVLNLIQNNTARIEMLEAVLFNDITTNPFLILFDDLDGVTATGVWNAALQRIEC